jgi:hypothetical protein
MMLIGKERLDPHGRAFRRRLGCSGRDRLR